MQPITPYGGAGPKNRDGIHTAPRRVYEAAVLASESVMSTTRNRARPLIIRS